MRMERSLQHGRPRIRHPVHPQHHEHLLDRGRRGAHNQRRSGFSSYVMRDREFIGRLIDRARAAKCGALVFTLDLQIIGQRHKDIKNGLSAPPKLTANTLLDLVGTPRWCWQMLRTRRPSFGNLVGHVAGVRDMSSLLSWTAQQFDPTLNWDDVAWIKERWGGKLSPQGNSRRRGCAPGGNEWRRCASRLQSRRAST